MARSRLGLIAGAFATLLITHVPSANAGTVDKFTHGYNSTLGGSGCDRAGCGVAFSIDLETGAETTLHEFWGKGSDGYYPVGGLVHIGKTLYGATERGGADGLGTVFAIDRITGKEKILYAFKGDGDGLYPLAGLTKVGRTLYGTTSRGGDGDCGNRHCGAVFSIDSDSGIETLVHSFDGADGYYPEAGLISIGNSVFGTTNVGGNQDDCSQNSACVVFSVGRKNGDEKVLYSFPGGTGGSPGNGRLLDVGTMLYGTTPQGGDYFGGTVFSVDRKTGAMKVLHAFAGGSDGYDPQGGLTAVGGVLYGTTYGDGEYLRGTVYSVNPDGSGDKVLLSFDGTDGAGPMTNLINVAGTLYGTTQSDGTSSACGGQGCGTVFSIDPSAGAETVIHSFSGPDGIWPTSDLLYFDGKLYGTTYFGGP